MKKSDYDVLQALLRGESVGGSRLKGELLDKLKEEQLLIPSRHGSRVSYRAADAAAIRRVFNVCNPASATTRAELVERWGDSKLVPIRSCPGFPVNVYEPLNATLHETVLTLHPTPGAFTFIADWESFKIPSDVIVVGVENMENFRCVKRQRYLFEQLGAPVLFASRYPQSGDFAQWLRGIPNKYIHFGDFDLAGIHIYLTEFRKYLDNSRCEFFIPRDIETLLAQGSRERYDSQIARFGKLTVDDPRLEYLISLLHKYRKGYDQEGLIR